MVAGNAFQSVGAAYENDRSLWWTPLHGYDKGGGGGLTGSATSFV